MKALIFKNVLLASFLSLIGVFSISAQNERNISPRYMGMGPGPVISISESYESLPEAIKTFVVKHFPSATATEITKMTFQNTYKLELSNGYELSFYAAGGLLKIEAPNNASIPSALLKELLPHSAYKFITDRKMELLIKEIKHDIRYGYKVELNNLYFDSTGKHIEAPLDRD